MFCILNYGCAKSFLMDFKWFWNCLVKEMKDKLNRVIYSICTCVARVLFCRDMWVYMFRRSHVWMNVVYVIIIIQSQGLMFVKAEIYVDACIWESFYIGLALDNFWNCEMHVYIFANIYIHGARRSRGEGAKVKDAGTYKLTLICVWMDLFYVCVLDMYVIVWLNVRMCIDINMHDSLNSKITYKCLIVQPKIKNIFLSYFIH